MNQYVQALDTATGEIVEIPREAAEQAAQQLADGLDHARVSGGHIGADGFYIDEVSGDVYDDEDIGGDGEGAAGLLKALVPGFIPLGMSMSKGLSRGISNLVDRRLERKARRGDKGAERRLKARRARRRAGAPVAAPASAPARPSMAMAPRTPAGAFPQAPSQGFPGGFNPYAMMARFAPGGGVPFQGGRPAHGSPAAVRPQPPGGGFGQFFQQFLQQSPRVGDDGGPMYGDYFDGAPVPQIGADGTYADDVDYDDDGNGIGYDADEYNIGAHVEEDQFLHGCDAECDQIGAEDDSDEDYGIGGDEIGRGGRRRRRLGRLNKVRSRLAARLRRVRPGSRRAKRIQRRLSSPKSRLNKVTRKLQSKLRSTGNRGAASQLPSRVSSRGARPSSTEEIMNIAPSLPQEGDLVFVPLLTTAGVKYSTGKLTLATAAAATSGGLELKSEGITYASLRLIGLLVECSTTGSINQQVFFEVTALSGDGDLPALYGANLCVLDHKTFGTGTGAIGTGYGRLFIIGLRDKARIEKTQTVKATVAVTQVVSAAAGSVRYLVIAQAVYNSVYDPAAAASQ